MIRFANWITFYNSPSNNTQTYNWFQCVLQICEYYKKALSLSHVRDIT